MFFSQPDSTPQASAIHYQPAYALHAQAVSGSWCIGQPPSVPLLGDQLVNTSDLFVPGLSDSIPMGLAMPLAPAAAFKLFVPLVTKKTIPETTLIFFPAPAASTTPVDGQFEARHDDLSQTYADPAAPAENQK